MLLPEGRKLNNMMHLSYWKAGLLVCFFFCCQCAFATNTPATPDWKFDSLTNIAYRHVLNLELEEARAMIPKPETAQQHYVLALADAIELMITEDISLYNGYEQRYLTRKDRKIKKNNPDELLLQAEMELQWAFVYLKYGHEYDAGLRLRDAYKIKEDVLNRFPDYKAIKKTSGVIDAILGSVPEKFKWVLALLGMEGSITFGLGDLEALLASDHPLAYESRLVYALINGFVLQKPGVGAYVMREGLRKNPDNKLGLFITASIQIKNSNSEEALKHLMKLGSLGGTPIHYCDYLKGEVFLHKGEYAKAIDSYRYFLNHYIGKNYTKDATYKMGICYYLNGNVNESASWLSKAKTVGVANSEADKYAAWSLEQPEKPHLLLTKVRYATDGGYYEKANQLLATITAADIPTKRDQVEFAYRKARIAHKTNEIATAKVLYQETMDLSGNEHWYYAPNACLQMGYIAVQENDRPRARYFFSRSLSYEQHVYKNSIDSKARSALVQLNRLK